MGSLEAEDDCRWRELIQIRKELQGQNRSVFSPPITRLTSSCGKNVLGSGDVGSEFVRLIKERQGPREDSSESRGIDASTSSAIGRATQVPQVMMAEFMSQDKPNLFIEELVLTSDFSSIDGLDRIDKPHRRTDKPSILREHFQVFIQLASAEGFVVRFELRDVRFDFEQSVRDRHQGQTLIITRGKRVYFAGSRVGDKRDVSDDRLFVRGKRIDQRAHDHAGLVAKPIDVHRVDRVDQR